MLVLHSKQLQEKCVDIQPFQSLCLPLVSLLVLHTGWQESETLSQAVWGQRQGHSSGKSAARHSETLSHSQSLLSTVYSDQRLFLYLESTRPPLTHESDVPRSNADLGFKPQLDLFCTSRFLAAFTGSGQTTTQRIREVQCGLHVASLVVVMRFGCFLWSWEQCWGDHIVPGWLDYNRHVSNLRVGCCISNATPYGLCSSCILCHYLCIYQREKLN